MNEYQKGNYGKIGSYLREGGFQKNLDKKYTNLVRNMNKIINESPRGNKNIQVYRGYPARFIQPGKDLTNRSFLSTTTNINMAKKFGNSVVKITVPRNLRRHTMKNNREKEILIERGTRLTDIKYVRPLANNKNLFTATLVSNRSMIPNSPRTHLKNYMRLNLNSNNESSNFNN